MYSITFRFEQKGLAPITLSGIEPDQSLLEVALKNDIDLHHNCGGVCACSTCHLYVDKGDSFLEELSDQEENFIAAQEIEPSELFLKEFAFSLENIEEKDIQLF